jgi:hypothetical protein
MDDGSTVTIRPELAPAAMLTRYPWLRGLRFFYVFYRSALKPQEVVAFDRDGDVLASRKSWRGSFFTPIGR